MFQRLFCPKGGSDKARTLRLAFAVELVNKSSSQCRPHVWNIVSTAGPKLSREGIQHNTREAVKSNRRGETRPGRAAETLAEDGAFSALAAANRGSSGGRTGAGGRTGI
jgi:hypothetical protein